MADTGEGIPCLSGLSRGVVFVCTVFTYLARMLTNSSEGDVKISNKAVDVRGEQGMGNH